MAQENTTKVTVSYPFPFFAILTLIFITLKLIGVITWSWFWVLSPMIFSFAIFILFLLAFVVWVIFNRDKF